MAHRDSPFYVRPRLDGDLLRWAWQFRRYCTPDAAHRGFDALLALSRASLALYEDLARTPDVRFFFRRAGLLHVYVTDEGAAGAQGEQEALRAAGFRTTLLDTREARAFQPALGDGVRGGLFIEGEAHTESLGFVRAIAAACQRRQVRLLEHTTVRGVRLGRRRVEAVDVESRSGREAIAADVVVIAAGAWSAAIAAPLGIRIPLQPAKGYSCTIDAFDGMPTVPILIQERRVIITPLDGRVRFGGTLELAGFDPIVDPVRYRAVVRAAREVLRRAPPMQHEEAWCGFRPVTPDGLPIIDRAGAADGLIVATGHAMLGITQAPITGRLVAELAEGRTPSVPLEPLRLDRFSPRAGRGDLGLST
jgi:D-amino-acid dehydrogenase